MDKLENWVTWILMAALLYKVSQESAPCNTASSTGFGVTDALSSGAVANQLTSGLAGYRSLRGLSDCGCGGNCGGCA